mmetsp:Transcript_19966/g.47121  ORF Transcript_19966/g.47121 Transcript_19966/m.47121 type:complete len:473 (+) Transcript_19966:88-1506(+)
MAHAIGAAPAVAPAPGLDAVTAWARTRSEGKVWPPPVHSGRGQFDEDYALGRVIGRGAFGVVYSATHRATGIRVAVKMVQLPDSSRGAARRAYEEAAQRELETLCKLSHPHIVSMIEAFKPEPRSPTPTWISVLELCLGCDLQIAVDNHGALPLPVVRQIAAQLASAVEHMHAHGVVHRDLTPAHILALGSDVTGPNVEIKILDFGHSCGLDHEFVNLYRSALVLNVSARQTPVVEQWSWQGSIISALGGRTSKGASPSRPIHNSLKNSTNSNTPTGRRNSRAEGANYNLSNEFSSLGDLNSAPSGAAEPKLREEIARYTFEIQPSLKDGYTAPEITDYRRFRAKHSESGSVGIVVDATVVVDAYSVGCVLRYLLTGVPPSQKVPEYIAAKTASPISMLGRVARACAGKPVQNYRYMAELHDIDGFDVSQILSALTDRDPAKRMTISDFNEHAWIANVDVASLRELRLSRHV